MLRNEAAYSALWSIDNVTSHIKKHCVQNQSSCIILAVVTKITDLIQGGNRSVRKILSLLKQMNSAYGDLFLHTEMRWLSREKFLIRFYVTVLKVNLPGCKRALQWEYP
jgi:hypothetical protein